MSPELSRQLDLEEGRISYAYQDNYGYWSIGCGRLIDKRKGGRLRDIEIDFLKSNDVDEAEQHLDSTYPWYKKLSRCRKDAMIQMAFELGYVGLAEFHQFLLHMSLEEWDKAADSMKDSLWFKQLSARVTRLSKQIVTNTYQYPT